MGSVRSVPLGAGPPGNDLIGDAQVMSNWGHMSIDANPDMMKARRRVGSLEPEYRFCFPTAVDFDPEIDRIIVADSQRNRLQIYGKVRDYRRFPGEFPEAVRAARPCRPPWLPRGRQELSGGAHAYEMPEQRTVRDDA